MQEKFLITNSDDFGMNKSITDAIIETHINGIITSTTLMVNMPGFDYAIKKAKEYPSLGVGIHFNLTEGKPISPLSQIPDLIDEKGFFKKNTIQRKNLLVGKRIYRQAFIELSAQLEKMISNGIVPTHFDSHHHITGLPMAFRASIEAAKNFKISKARITNIDYNYSSTYNGSILSKTKNKFLNTPKVFIHNRNKARLRKKGFKTPDTKVLTARVLPVQPDEIKQFLQTLSVLKPGVTEISFHPGYKNSNLEDSDKFAAIRIRDLNVTTSIAVKNYLIGNKIHLISYKDL